MIYILFLKEMIYGADLFQMEDVRNECISYYSLSLCDKNCLTIKDIADLRAMTELSAKCLNHALERFKLVDDHVFEENLGHGLNFLKSATNALIIDSL